MLRKPVAASKSYDCLDLFWPATGYMHLLAYDKSKNLNPYPQKFLATPFYAGLTISLIPSLHTPIH